MSKSDFKSYLNNISEEEIARLNKVEENRVNKEYGEFTKFFDTSECYICKQSLYNFSINNVCLHNLLRFNKKFKKKNFKDIYLKWGYFNIQSYLRWVANYRNEGFINDLEEEKGKSKKIETTITWKNIEWTFSCSNTDFLGHSGTQSEFPHYHFQMRIDKKPFIDFGNFHIPFSDEDLFNFDFIESDKAIHSWNYGTGIQGLLLIGKNLL